MYNTALLTFSLHPHKHMSPTFSSAYSEEGYELCQENKNKFFACVDEAKYQHPDFGSKIEGIKLAFRACRENAEAAGGDDEDEVSEEMYVCYKTYLDKFKRYCFKEVEAMKECRPSSFAFDIEDFELDLAEELPFSDACKALQKETGPLYKCATDAASKDFMVAMKLVKAQDTFNTCTQEAAMDVDKLLECWKTFSGVLIESGCSTEVKQLEDTCGIPSFEFEDFALDLAEDEELESTAYATYLRR